MEVNVESFQCECVGESSGKFARRMDHTGALSRDARAQAKIVGGRENLIPVRTIFERLRSTIASDRSRPFLLYIPPP
jgi:hypothetical protein